MTAVATASVPTAHGSRYLQQLCKHWTHNLAVTFDATRGEIVFPRDHRGGDWPGEGRVVMEAGAEALDVRVEGSTPAHLAGLQGAVASHLDRFALREAPLPFDWVVQG